MFSGKIGVISSVTQPIDATAALNRFSNVSLLKINALSLPSFAFHNYQNYNALRLDNNIEPS